LYPKTGEFIVINGVKDLFYTTLTGPDDGYLQLRSYAWNNNGKPDNDGNTPAQEASVQWAAVLMDQVWNTPGYLGTVKFLADNKLQYIPRNNITGEKILCKK
jgi:hypothetical protein